MSENFTPDPKHISELLAASVCAQPDGERARIAKKADLQSEIGGFVTEIADIQADMRQTGDPNLPKVLDDATIATMLAQREQRNLEE